MIELKPKETHETDIYDVKARSRLLSDGKMVIYGDSNFHILARDGRQEHKIKGLCDHIGYDIDILPLVIQNTQYVAVSCHPCCKIHLVNIEDLNTIPQLVYKIESDEIGPMCHGPNGTIYTASRKTGQVSVLGCSTLEMTLLESIHLPNKLQPTHLICIAQSETIIFSSFEENVVRAFGTNGTLKWDISEDIQKNKYKPTGMAYIGELDALLLGDYKINRILLISASSGQWMKSIPFESGSVENIHRWGNEFLVHHDTNIVMFSHFTVSSTQCVFIKLILFFPIPLRGYQM